MRVYDERVAAKVERQSVERAETDETMMHGRMRKRLRFAVGFGFAALFVTAMIRGFRVHGPFMMAAMFLFCSIVVVLGRILHIMFRKPTR